MQTINTFFGTESESTAWVSSVIQSQEFALVKQSLNQEIKGFTPPSTFYERMIGKLTSALDIEIQDILVWSWRKRNEIIQYRDKGKYPPGETQIVPLLEHSVVSKHNPTIKVMVNQKEVHKIKFDVLLKLMLKGAMLGIRDGKIMEIMLGSCSGSGSVQYAGLTILERKTAPLNLPATITLGEGISI
jgi:hypothetical protein